MGESLYEFPRIVNLQLVFLFSEWQSGDIVSVLLTWNGILSYWLNGKNLGVAMRNIDTSKIWYPGLSLSVDQYCRFIVNRNEFRYMYFRFSCFSSLD